MKKSLLLAASAALVLASCNDPKPVGPNNVDTGATLSVDVENVTDGVGQIVFNADGSGGVPVINVTTNQDSWDFVIVPFVGENWLDAVKKGNTIELTATPNTLPTAPPDLTLEITAGTAPKISLTIKQLTAEKGLSLPEMVSVEGGTFAMGSMLAQDQPPTEMPVRNITVSSFQIGKYEVKQDLWVEIMKDEYGNNNPSKSQDPDMPVENVEFDDIQAFITALNEQTGKNYRLPTEAEWEYAARGGKNNDTYTYSGSNDLGSVAWYVDNSEGSYHKVGEKAPNSLGICDMSGNVAEWCSDWFGIYAELTGSDATDPQGPASNSMMKRIQRGGNWGSSSEGGTGLSVLLTVTGRGSGYVNRTDMAGGVGFRLVLPAGE